MQAREFQMYKNCIKRSSYKNNKTPSRLSMRKEINLFEQTEASNLNPFESIFISNEDKSAIISLTIRSYNLCNDEEFWTKELDLENVMGHYATNEESNIKNLYLLFIYLSHFLCHFSCPKKYNKL